MGSWLAHWADVLRTWAARRRVVSRRRSRSPFGCVAAAACRQGSRCHLLSSSSPSAPHSSRRSSWAPSARSEIVPRLPPNFAATLRAGAGSRSLEPKKDLPCPCGSAVVTQGNLGGRPRSPGKLQRRWIRRPAPRDATAGSLHQMSLRAQPTPQRRVLRTVPQALLRCHDVDAGTE